MKGKIKELLHYRVDAQSFNEPVLQYAEYWRQTCIKEARSERATPWPRLQMEPRLQVPMQVLPCCGGRHESGKYHNNMNFPGLMGIFQYVSSHYYPQMSRHLKKSHQVKSFKGPEKFLIHEERHACKICHKMIRHDYHYLWCHFSQAHRLKLSTYFHRYIISEEETPKEVMKLFY